MTCKGCKYSNSCIMYEPEMKACKDYTKTSIEEKVNSFEKVITSDLFDEIIE